MPPSDAPWIVRLVRRLRGERGATSLEYAIFAGLIAAVIITAVVFLGERTTDNFDCTGDSWQQRTNQC